MSTTCIPLQANFKMMSFLPQVVHWIPPIKDRGTKPKKSI
jgi:hypothetical protein